MNTYSFLLVGSALPVGDCECGEHPTVVVQRLWRDRIRDAADRVSHQLLCCYRSGTCQEHDDCDLERRVPYAGKKL